MNKTLGAMLALVIALAFGTVTFVQADETAAPAPAAPAAPAAPEAPAAAPAEKHESKKAEAKKEEGKKAGQAVAKKKAEKK